jgi:hypothetical protein
VTAGSHPVAGVQEPACAYSLTPAKLKFTRHEPILLKLVIANSSDAPLPVSLGYDREGAFAFTVRRPDGSVIELPRKTVREGIALVGSFNVEPRESHTQQLILNEWYDFSETGAYEVAVKLKSPRGQQPVCLETRFTIEITPLDTAQLRQTCSELVETIKQNRHNAGNALDAAQALLVVKQPLAVPFLAEALKANGMVSSLIITGLEEIGNEEAVKVLIPLLDVPDRINSDFPHARGALLRVQKKTTDPATLELINIALARVN